MKKLIDELEKRYEKDEFLDFRDALQIVRAHNPWHEVTELPPRQIDSPTSSSEYSIGVLLTDGVHCDTGCYDYMNGEWYTVGLITPTHWAYFAGGETMIQSDDARLLKFKILEQEPIEIEILEVVFDGEDTAGKTYKILFLFGNTEYLSYLHFWAEGDLSERRDTGNPVKENGGMFSMDGVYSIFDEKYVQWMKIPQSKRNQIFRLIEKKLTHSKIQKLLEVNK